MVDADPLIGRLVASRYRVDALLGEGGMGHVFRGTHEAIEKSIALKVLKPEYSAKGEIVQRFKQEAISASRIKHPNVLDVFDFGQLDDGRFFLAMELLEGEDLAEVLERDHVVESSRAVRIGLQVTRALAAAHKAGVVHRDLKPENIFLQVTAEGDENVKIVDFGIAQLRDPKAEAEAAETGGKRRRLTRTGMIFGTPEYMSPEQAAGKPTDHRVDIYAVGVILFEMLTGTVPFTGDTFMAVLAAHLGQETPSLRSMYDDVQASPELEAAVMRAMEKDPGVRFGEMTALAEALADTPEGGQVAAGAVAATVALKTAPDQRPTRGERNSDTQVDPRPAKTAPRLVVDESDPASVKPSGAPIGLLAVLALLLIGGGAAALVVLGVIPTGSATTSPPPATPGPATATQADTAPSTTASAPPDDAASAAPSAAPAASAAEIRLDIETAPAGATVFKDGAQVCDESPCDITVPRNTTVEIEAAKGPLKARRKVYAQKPQTVKLTLVGSAPRKAPRPPSPKPKVKTCLREFTDENGFKMVKEVPCQ